MLKGKFIVSKINIRDRNKGKPDKKPNWEYRFEAAKVDGKRKHISKSGFRTKKEALEAGTKALAEYNNSGLHFEPSEISVSDYVDYYFDQYIKTNLKYNTQLNKVSVFENHIKPNFGHYKLKSLNASILQEYANGLKLKGLSKSSIEGILSSFSAALDYAVEPLHYIAMNPMQYVKLPKVERKPRERIILQPEEWKRIIDRFQPPSRFYIPLMIGYYTGMRISEVFGLTWDDVDFYNRTISVNKQVVKRNYGVDVRAVLNTKGKKEEKSAWYFQSLKTDSSERVVKFGDALYNALKAELARQKENELMYGEYFTIQVIKSEKDEKNNTIERIIPVQKCIDAALPRTHLICISENGEYTSTDSFKYPSRIIHHELGIAFDFHSLRHTHATKLIEAGVSPKTVQARLGHQNIETTLQTYVHDTEQMEENAVDIFEKIAMGV